MGAGAYQGLKEVRPPFAILPAFSPITQMSIVEVKLIWVF